MVATGALLQDRYCIEEPIKKTNLSAVYKAKDQRLSSTVAIKENCFNDEEFCLQFRREARLLANLRHHLLPKVSDHFTEGDSQFLVMEYIPGKDLREMLREREDRNEGPFEPDLALQWADQLLDVLEYLHGHPEPIVHRDIKPQNLKLAPRGEVVLLDFGLAKGSPTLSGRKSSSIHGFTFAYASLEQIRDEGTNPRSDLYSLGATLYHLMTGVTPPDAFERLNARASGYNPLRPAHELNPQVAPAVSAALDKAMALYPHERPANAADLRQMLREANRKAGAELAPAEKPKKLALAPGTLLQKRYRLVELIKQTDASAVYKARDQRLGHVVILKEHSCGDGGARRELRRKAQLLAGLHHPALPVVTDFSVSGDSLFLVMEYIPGKDLREALREREDRSEGPFEPDLALEWADQLLDALEYLHGQEEPILHHGVKPQNLKLGPRGEVRLLDFGLAKGSLTLVGGGLHGSALTYASLEQIKGEEADPRSDLYSLGATLYRLMTGVTPRNAIERLEARASGYNPLRPAHEVNQQIPPAVSAALDKAMALYPQERPASAAELRQMLRQAKRKTVIERLPRPQMPKLKMPSRPVIIGAAAIIVLAVIASLILWWSGELATPENRGGAPSPAPSNNPVASSGLLLDVKPIGVLSAPREINKVAISPDGQFVVSVGQEKTVRLWPLSDGRQRRELTGHQKPSRAVAISPDGQTVASGDDEGKIRLWQAGDGNLLKTLEGHEQEVFHVSFSSDGQTLVSVDVGKTLRWWEVNNGAILNTVKLPPENLIAAITLDQRIAGLYNSENRGFWLWSLSENSLLRDLRDHRYELSCGGAFSPDGRLLALGSAEGTLRLWQASDGLLSRPLPGPGGATRSVAFSPDGQVVAAGWSDGSIWLWSVSDGRLVKRLKGHRNDVSSLAFRADGQTLVSGSKDRTIGLWELVVGR